MAFLHLLPLYATLLVGLAATASVQKADCDNIPGPTGIKVIPGVRTAESYWQASPVSVNACPITSFLVVVRSGDGPSLQNVKVEVDDNPDRKFRVDLEHLTPDRDYQLFGVLVSGERFSNLSKEVVFKTESE